MAVIFDISQTIWFQQGWEEGVKMAREELRLTQMEENSASPERTKARLKKYRFRLEKYRARLKKYRFRLEKYRAEIETEKAIRMSIEILLIKEIPIEYITNKFSVSRDYVLEIQKGIKEKK